MCVLLLFFNRCWFRSNIWRDLELPPFHPRRRACGDRPAQRQPSGGWNFSSRGEDRSGDALSVDVLRCCWTARGPRNTYYFALHTCYQAFEQWTLQLHFSIHTSATLSIPFMTVLYSRRMDETSSSVLYICIYHAYPLPLDTRIQLDWRHIFTVH